MGAPDKLNILYVLHKAHPAEPSYNEHVLALHEQHNVTICIYFEREDIIPDTIKVFEGNETVWGFVRTLRAALRFQPYDVIHLHTSHVGMMFLLAAFPWWRKWLPLTVFTVHSSYSHYRLKHRLMLLVVFACFQRVVCCSQASYDSFPKLYRWLVGSRLRVIPNGVDIRRVDRALEDSVSSREPDAPFTVVSVARFDAVKNLITLIRAFGEARARVPGKLVLIGEGPERSLLETEIRQLGLQEHVRLTGLISREDVYRALKTMDLFVSTSWVEGLPMAVLEAMACACPVVLSDIPAHREIAHAGTAFIPLVPAQDSRGFAAEIARYGLMAHQERHDMGVRCRSHVEQYFTLDSMQQQYSRVYREIIANTKKRS